jgi:molybdate transport system substrate-binding protein
MSARNRGNCWRGFAAAAALLLAFCGASAEELKVAYSGAMTEVVKVLGPAFEARTGTKVALTWGPSMGASAEAIPNRLNRGEPFDVVVMASEALDGLSSAGKVDPASRVVLARSLIVVAVKSGAAKPDISTVDALKKTLLDAKSVAFSSSASGVYISNVLFPRLGIAEQMKAKSRQIPGGPVGPFVARGEVELAFQQLSELKPIPGIDIVGPLPEGAQLVSMFSAAVVTGSANPSGARTFIDFLASPAAASTIRDTGLEPTQAAAR